MAQLMPLPLTVCCFSKIQIGFTFLVPAHLGSPGKGPLNNTTRQRWLWRWTSCPVVDATSDRGFAEARRQQTHAYQQIHQSLWLAHTTCIAQMRPTATDVMMFHIVRVAQDSVWFGCWTLCVLRQWQQTHPCKQIHESLLLFLTQWVKIPKVKKNKSRQE